MSEKKRFSVEPFSQKGSIVARIKAKAKTREEIRIETRELKRTDNVDGTYNPFNLCRREVLKRLEQKFVPFDDVLVLVQKDRTEHNKHLQELFAEMPEYKYDDGYNLELTQWMKKVRGVLNL